MTDTTKSEELKRYLFREMSPEESETLEERFFENSDLFYEVAELENDLIDRYSRGKLAGKDLTRFEQSLTNSPERQSKIANARALQTFIAEEKSVPAPVPPNVWERLANFFTWKTPAFQYAVGALAILLACANGFLLYQNQQSRQELAQIQNERNRELAEKENSLQSQLDQAREREQNLQRQIESERGQNEITSEQLENERVEKLRLERELQNLRQQKNLLPPRENPSDINAPTIASAFLLPTAGTRGGADETKIIAIDSNTKSVRLSLQIPAESNAESFSVKLDGAQISTNQKPRRTRSGSRVLDVTLAAQKLGETGHTIAVGANEYLFRLRRR